MTTYSNVKSCMASLKGAQASFKQMAIKAQHEEASRVFHECMMETEEIVLQLQQRILFLEREEPQYQGD